MKGWKAVALFVIIFLFAVMVGYNGLQTIQEEWEVFQQQKTAKEEPETSQAPWWQQEEWKQLQEEFSKSAQERETVESAENQAENQTENQTENHIKSNVDYTSYLEITDSPHIITDSYGFRYIVGSFKNISSVELDHVSVSFRLYDEDGNQIGNTVVWVDDLLPGKTWKYKTYISNEVSYFELAEINVYP